MVDLSNELSKSNEVILLTLKDDKVDADYRNFYRFDLTERVNYINLGLPDGFSLKAQLKVYQQIRKLNPDVVHINDKNLCKFIVLPLYFLNTKVKYFMTIHNDLHNGYASGFNKFVFNTLGRWKKIKFAAISQTNYTDMLAYYPTSQFKCIVNGRAPIVATEKYAQVEEELEQFRQTPSTKIFLHVARFHSQKNQKLLVDAFNDLASNGVDVQLVIIGAGFDSKEGMALLNNAGKNIHYLGTRKNICDYMLYANVFCLSSAFEGMPITLLEASLAGTPCVSTPVCGSVDLIVDGTNGYLSTGFTKDEYIEALCKTLDNYDTVKAGAMAMKDNSKYTIKECAKKYWEYFKE